jgi:hypothetical protein
MMVVYFIRRADGTGPVKIGCSAQVDARVAQLSSNHKARLVILACAPGSFRDESRLHRQFASLRLHGEWFEPSPEIMAAVAHVGESGRLPDPVEEDREVVMAARYLEGDTLQAIGDEFGLTRERVRQLLRAAGVPSLGVRAAHRRSAAPIADWEREVAEVYSTGETSPSEICSRYGLEVAKLYGVLRRTGTRRFPKGHFARLKDDAEITAQCADLYRQGLKAREIAERIPALRHHETVYKYLARAGVTPSRLGGKRRGELQRAAPQIIRDYVAGATFADLSERYGASKEGITNLVRRHGVRLSEAEMAARRMAAETRRIAAVRAANTRRHAARKTA